MRNYLFQHRNSKLRLGVLLAASVSLTPSVVLAQETGAPTGDNTRKVVEENPIRAANDAFGTSIGRETIGVYSAQSVRGFSPYAAGNIRIDGLYIDAIVLPNNRLVSSSSIRVGISALGYAFPAPTGIADYRLRTPGKEYRASALVGVNGYGGTNAELNLEIPVIGDQVSIGGGFNIANDPKLYWGGNAIHATGAAVARIEPASNVQIYPFFSYFTHADEDTHPRLTVTGSAPPPRIERREYYGQNWTKWTQEDVNWGVIAKFQPGAWQITSGVFRSVRTRDRVYSDQFQGVSSDGSVANHRIVASPGSSAASTSGEIRLSRLFKTGELRHQLHLSARGRQQVRTYGGGSVVDFGAEDIFDRRALAKPAFQLRPTSQDTVEQYSGGIAYQGIWPGHGEISLGLQKVNYTKVIETPNGALPETDSQPWLYNIGMAGQLGGGVALYAGYTRGLEESAAAPETATNRDQAPSAILTKQYDAGIRWGISKDMKIVGGYFNVEKPYFSVDANRLYRQLGEVRHRGFEASFTGRLTDNLNVVAGVILIDASVSGEAVSSGAVGRRPVGATDRLISLNGEYQIPLIDGLAIDAGLTVTGDRIANTKNTLSVSGSTIVDLGLRYKFALGGKASTFRLQITNLTDAYSWEVVSSNTFAYERPREVTARLTVNF